jgi:hypothetical protein
MTTESEKQHTSNHQYLGDKELLIYITGYKEVARLLWVSSY